MRDRNVTFVWVVIGVVLLAIICWAAAVSRNSEIEALQSRVEEAERCPSRLESCRHSYDVVYQAFWDCRDRKDD